MITDTATDRPSVPGGERRPSDSLLIAALVAATIDPDPTRILLLGADAAATRLLAASGALVDVVDTQPDRVSSTVSLEDEFPGLQVFVGSIQDVPAQPTYDLIVAVEHTPVPMSVAVVDAIAARLLPAGRAVVAVRNRLGRHALSGSDVVGIGMPALSRGELQATLDAGSLRARIAEMTLADDGSFLLVDRESMEGPASATEAWLAWIARPPLGSSAVGVEEHLWRGLSREGVGRELCDAFVISLTRRNSAQVVAGAGAVAAFWNVEDEPPAAPACVSVASGEVLVRGQVIAPLTAFDASETFADRFGRSGDAERRRLLLAWIEALSVLDADEGVPLAAFPRNMLMGVDGVPVLIGSDAGGDRAPIDEVLERGAIWLALDTASPLDDQLSRKELAARIGLVLRLRPSDVWIPDAIAAEAHRLAAGGIGPEETASYWIRHLSDHLAQPLGPAPAPTVSPDSALLVAQRRVDSLEAGARVSARVFEQQQLALASERDALLRQLHDSRQEAEAARSDSAALRNSRAFRTIAALRARVDRVAPWGTHRRGLYERSLRLAARAARRSSRRPVVGEVARFTVPSSETPLITIVIPAYGHADYTIRCLRALAAHHEGHEVEVLVVDDASPDDAVSQLRGIEGLRILELPGNLGFTLAANAGIAAARGDHVLMLNNDAEPTSGWITALLSAVGPDVGIVGAKLVYPDGRLQEAGGIMFDDASGWNYGKFDDPEDPRYTFRKEVDYCSGAAILLTKTLLEVVPRFDERYAPAYYEDVDMAFESRAHGLKVIYEPKAIVVHHEGISHGSDETSGVKQYQILNRDKFFEKWSETLASQRPPGQVALASVRRTGIGTIVVVDHMVPTWHEDAGSLRMVRVIRTLRGMGYDIVFLPENRHRAEPYTSQLQSQGVLIWYGWGDIWTYLREIERDVAVTILSRASIASAFLRQIREVLPDTSIIYDTVDLHFLREQRRVDVGAPGARPRGVQATRELELALVRSTELTVVVSDAEKVILDDLVPGAHIHVIPTAHDSVARTEDISRTDITFVGSFQHDPNTDAVRWLVAEIFPLVLTELPDARLTVVGKNPPSDVVASAPPEVAFLGWVEDLEPIHARTLVSVAPIRYGAGVKGKVGEAWAHGIPVVMTSVAAEGMDVEAGVTALVSDDPAGIAAAIVDLHRSPELWQAVSEAGSRHVDQKFGAARIRELLSTAIESARER